MQKLSIPLTPFAHIGGSATWNCSVAEALGPEDVRIIEDGLQFDTPFGRTAPVRLLELEGTITADGTSRYVLDAVFHGWNGLSPYDETPEERLFWIFREAGVRYIIADGTVGSINPLLRPGDVIIPSDFIDYTKRYSNIGKFTDDILDSEQIVCPELAVLLAGKAEEEFRRVFSEGTYGVYECPRLQSPAEARKFYFDHCDVIGHTMMPEAILARAIGAAYAPLYLVSGESGLFRRASNDWYDCPEKVAKVILKTLGAIDTDRISGRSDEHRIVLDDTVKSRITYREE